ncbi:unnamed protein product [Linum trigynum]|uniref:Uncharacterized protein n=1 Tax=Linum trigynum TaxID=586398 RepID=A0AAV2GIV0_9ROSI
MTVANSSPAGVLRNPPFALDDRRPPSPWQSVAWEVKVQSSLQLWGAKGGVMVSPKAVVRPGSEMERNLAWTTVTTFPVAIVAPFTLEVRVQSSLVR